MNEELKIIKKEFAKIKKLDYIRILNANEKNIIKKVKELLYQNTIIKNNNLWNLKLNINKYFTNKYIILFDSNPNSKESIDYLINKYGLTDQTYKKTKVLNTTIQGNTSTLVGTRFLFKLQVNYEEERIYLAIYNNQTLYDKKIYWDFKSLKNKLYKKYNYVIYIKTWNKIINKSSYFKFYDIIFYQLKSFDTFIKLIENGIIRINISTTLYKKGLNEGKIANKKISFEIEEVDIIKLFDILRS